MTTILSSDILIADVIVATEGNPYVMELIARYDLKPGGKRQIDAHQFQEFSAAVEGRPITLSPGGSTANMLTTLGKLFDKKLNITLIGVAGGGMSSQMIKSSLDEAGIVLVPEHPPVSPVPQTAMSYVMVYPDGQRTIATYAGNARDILQPDMIGEAAVKASDIVLLQGSLWGKLGEGYADRLYRLALTHKKELWLALPTHSMLGDNHIETFHDIIPHAALVLGNEEEVARVFRTSSASALLDLQRMLDPKQVGFITLAEKGAAVITRDEVTYVPLHDGAPGSIVNTLGAGDAAFAGFAYGYLKKMPHVKSAAIGMALAAAKLHINGSRLPDPKKHLPM